MPVHRHLRIVGVIGHRRARDVDAANNGEPRPKASVHLAPRGLGRKACHDLELADGKPVIVRVETAPQNQEALRIISRITDHQTQVMVDRVWRDRCRVR